MQSPVFLNIVTFWGAGVRVSTYEFWGQHNSAYNSSVSYLSNWKSVFVRFDLLSIDNFLNADFVHQHFHHSFWIYAICILNMHSAYVFPLIHKIAQENRSDHRAGGMEPDNFIQFAALLLLVWPLFLWSPLPGCLWFGPCDHSLHCF